MRRSVMLASLLGWAAAPRSPASAASARELDLDIAARALQRAKRTWRARPLPPFVAYTLVRETRLNLVYDMHDSYRDRVWYRARDGVALTRRVGGDGELHLEQPTFDAAKDPGPPTADLFGLPLLSAAPPPEASDAVVIGRAVATAEYDYTVTRAQIVSDRGETRYLLAVRAVRDPDRNRLQEVIIDPETGALLRVKARDHLFVLDAEKRVIDVTPDAFDMTIANVAGVPTIVTIEARSLRRDGIFDATTYRFEDVTFPTSLPDWYFDEKSYGAHRKDAPS